jgi:hypothetical protein
MKDSPGLADGTLLLPGEAPAEARLDTGSDRTTNWAAGVRVLLVVLFIILVVVRIPAILAGGRFWAEEGVVYFFEAWYQPWFDALVWIHTGYLNIVASSAALLALHIAPLEHAPLVTNIVALVFQILPAVIIATSRIPWLDPWPAFAAALIILLIPANGAEVWLNSITSQFHLTLCVALILAADIRGGWIGVLRAMILVVAPLAGPVSGTLAPLFLLRAGLERSRARLVQTVLLSVPVLVQAAIVVTHPEPARSFGIGLPFLLAVIGVQDVILPFLGTAQTLIIGAADAHSFEKGGIPFLPILAAIFGIGVLGLALWRWGDRAALWLFAGGCTLAVACFSFALTGSHLLIWLGGRYPFASTVLLSLSLLGLATAGTLRQRMIPTVLVVLLIYTGSRQYFDLPPSFTHGANWKDEVAAWRRDPAYKLHMWPRGWTPELRLNPSVRPGE